MTNTFVTASVTATQGRQQFFDLINQAQYAGQITQILKNGQPVAKIVPMDAKKIDWQKLETARKWLHHNLTAQDYQDIKVAHDSLDTPRLPDW